MEKGVGVSIAEGGAKIYHIRKEKIADKAQSAFCVFFFLLLAAGASGLLASGFGVRSCFLSLAVGLMGHG